MTSSPPGPRRALVIDAAWCLAGAGVLAVFLATQLAHRGDLLWPDAFRIAIIDSLPWAAFAPLFFVLAARWPLDGPARGRALLVHLGASVAVLALLALVRPPGPHPPPRPGGPPQPGQGQPGFDHPPFAHPPEGAPPGFRRRGPPLPGEPRPPRFVDWFFRFGLQIHLPVLLLVVVGAQARQYRRRARERETQARELGASLTQARLEALRMQLQPHFLFNALNSIAALVHEDPDRADEMIGALSEFLRHTLHGAVRNEVPLIEEVEYTKRYLAIEQVRFGERLRCEIEIPPETYGALVPMLLLQPLVENGVRHGLAEKSGPATLRLAAVRDGSSLRLTIADNGPGLTGEVDEGIGLANTRRRLRELHGEGARVTLRSESGCVVEITLPFRTE